MQPADRDRRAPDSFLPLPLRAIPHTAHVPHRDPHGSVHSIGDLAEGHVASWEADWIDLGGEG